MSYSSLLLLQSRLTTAFRIGSTRISQFHTRGSLRPPLRGPLRRQPHLLLSSQSWLKNAARSSSSATSLMMEESSFEEEIDSEGLSSTVTAQYKPAGDQSKAIKQLVQQLKEGDRYSILRGITGTGKTFVLSHVMAQHKRPVLLLVHNKTLAAQLARELRGFLSNVELFCSYYNYYVPESYVETSDTYIAKKSSVNDELDALRHRATRALLQHNNKDEAPVVVVASVSCLYGLGLPTEYLEASRQIQVGGVLSGDELVEMLEQRMLYTRAEGFDDLLRGNYQITRDALQTNRMVLSVWPPHERFPVRIELLPAKDADADTDTWRVSSIQTMQQEKHSTRTQRLDSFHMFPAKHHVVGSDEILEQACTTIQDEMNLRVAELNEQNQPVQAQRLQQRVLNDLLLLRETGFCSGIENYSRHFSGKAPGEPPNTLLNYMSYHGDWLLVVDESHVTLPQLKAMYAGDRARKERLVKHGYRLPSALDNRPLRSDEFWEKVDQAVFVSATPSRQELELTSRPPVDMVIRPTFVCDPVIHVRPPTGQLDDLLEEIRKRAKQNERTLAVSLTKRDAEDLSSYLIDHGVTASYIHSGLTTHERSDALKALQTGEIDCLVGVNLLREGLDLPQVSLVAILNADSEGFLRSQTALLQTVGRAARNVNGTAVFYASRVTKSMQQCIEETNERRQKQTAYNEEFGKVSASTKGSSVMSIFDLLKDELQDEKPLEVVNSARALGEQEQKDKAATETISVALPPPSSSLNASAISDHLPSKPGVYFWRDASGGILYIGKAKKLRSRVKSYLTPGSKHTARIKAMLAKACSVDFMLTPSDRDALVLESNLIKHHQPPYNVLLKDDESYPYICATIGDAFPRFMAVPRKQIGEKASKYRYFGPYPHYNEINKVLQEIEEKYDLRTKSFAARHGSGLSKKEYRDIFNEVMSDAFDAEREDSSSKLLSMRSEFEEAGMLFDSPFNKCRDIATISQIDETTRSAIVQVLQLRLGLVSGRFSYKCDLPVGHMSQEDLSAALQEVLERLHYPSGESTPSGRFSFFPDELLVQFPLAASANLKRIIRECRRNIEPERKDPILIRTPSKRGPRKETDARAMNFAVDNIQELARDAHFEAQGMAKTSVDGTAVKELASLLSLETEPSRIECYDISHTQGEVAVGSRVVFIDGKPARHLYRRFNIKTVEGIDDYASLEEVIERRFRRAHSSAAKSGDVEPWSFPDLVVIDGGAGQLGAAIKGMAKVGIGAYPRVDGDLVEEQVVLSPTNGTVVIDCVDASKRFVAVCALAKNKEEVYVPGVSKPINNSPDSPALLLLRSLRDESHRFALHSHRQRRTARNGL